jgi:hypothetical protein
MVGGADLYLKVYRDRDQKAVMSPQFKQVLVEFKKLKGFVDAGSPGRNWNDATAMVVQGKAGVQIMGDWAKGEFAAAKQVAGKDFGCFRASVRKRRTSWPATLSCSRKRTTPMPSRRKSFGQCGNVSIGAGGLRSRKGRFRFAATSMNRSWISAPSRAWPS